MLGQVLGAGPQVLMTITTYLSAMLTADEYAAIIAVPSPVLLSDEHRAVFEHYKAWFIVLRASGLMAELDYVTRKTSGSVRKTRTVH